MNKRAKIQYTSEENLFSLSTSAAEFRIIKNNKFNRLFFTASVVLYLQFFCFYCKFVIIFEKIKGININYLYDL